MEHPGRPQDVARAGCEALRAGEFWQAHELFEQGFRGFEGAQRTLFHALSQVAAAHHQLSLGRARAAVRTWHKARAKLSQIGSLDPEFERAMAEFHLGLALTAEEPRFLDPARLYGQRFPVPAPERLQIPTA